MERLRLYTLLATVVQRGVWGHPVAGALLRSGKYNYGIMLGIACLASRAVCISTECGNDITALEIPISTYQPLLRRARIAAPKPASAQS